MKKGAFLIIAIAVLFALMSCSAGETVSSEATGTTGQNPQETKETATEKAEISPSADAAQPQLGFDDTTTDIEYTELTGIATQQDIDSIYGEPTETQTDGDMLQYLYRNVVISFLENENGEMIVCGIENYRPGSPFLIGGVKIAMDETEARESLEKNGYALQGTSSTGL
jgi:hypothetical protein